MPAPSKYKKEFCQKLIDHMSEGLSYECFAGEVSVTRRTMYTWEEKHPEWKEAKEHGQARLLKWWEKLGRALATGKIQGSAAVYIFTMKNHAKWTDKQDVNLGNQDGSPAFKVIINDYTAEGIKNGEPKKGKKTA